MGPLKVKASILMIHQPFPTSASSIMLEATSIPTKQKTGRLFSEKSDQFKRKELMIGTQKVFYRNTQPDSHLLKPRDVKSQLYLQSFQLPSEYITLKYNQLLMACLQNNRQKPKQTRQEKRKEKKETNN